MTGVLLLAAALASANVSTGGTVRITADVTRYDRKEGMAFLSGHVSVSDAQYQMHADRAYVFMGETNDLKRVVALGNVAITNDTKRAYGARASYYRRPGYVVLSSGSNTVAEVRNETPSGAQVLRGNKIRFWTESEQIEVLEANITTPMSGSAMDGLKKRMGGEK